MNQQKSATENNENALSTTEPKPKYALAQLAEKLAVKSDLLTEILKKTAFKECKTNEEFYAAVVIANSYGLNPMLKEIYAFPAKGGGVMVSVGIDGWIRLVNQQPTFMGHKFIHHKNESGKVESITCQIYIAGRDFPIEKTEYLAECKRSTEPWDKYPIRMLEHKAFIQCARYAFGFGGIYDSDEVERIIETEGKPSSGDDSIVSLRRENKAVEVDPKKSEPAKASPAAESKPAVDAEIVDTKPSPSNLAAQEWAPISEGDLKDLLDVAAKVDHSAAQVSEYVSIRYSIDDLGKIPRALYKEIITHFTAMAGKGAN